MGKERTSFKVKPTKDGFAVFVNYPKTQMGDVCLPKTGSKNRGVAINKAKTIRKQHSKNMKNLTPEQKEKRDQYRVPRKKKRKR